MGKFIALRPTLEEWAKKMEFRLRAKDKSHKKGWLDGNLHYYIVVIFECWREAVKAISFEHKILVAGEKRVSKGIKDHDKINAKEIELAIKKCVDGANFFMMLADNLRNIIKERGK